MKADLQRLTLIDDDGSKIEIRKRDLEDGEILYCLERTGGGHKFGIPTRIIDDGSIDPMDMEIIASALDDSILISGEEVKQKYSSVKKGCYRYRSA